MSERVTALREAMTKFMGRDQFRKFAKAGMYGGRLKWWQEKAWQSFQDAHPEFAGYSDELPAAIRICELHGEELLPDLAPVVRGKIRLLEHVLGTNLSRMKRYYPNAECGPFFVGDSKVEATSHQVWYCPICRENKAYWDSVSAEAQAEDSESNS